MAEEHEINTLTSYLGVEFQQKLMWQLLVEPEFAEKTIPLLFVEYFDDNTLKKLFFIIKEYFNDNEKPCNLQNDSVYQAIHKYKSSDPIEEELLLSVIQKIKYWNERVINKQLLSDGEIVRKSCFDFCKQQEIRKLGESIIDMSKKGNLKNFTTTYDTKVNKIAEIGIDENYGTELMDDIDSALRKNFRETIPTGIDFIDGINEGLGKGEVGIILTPSGVGKTTALTKIANTALHHTHVLQIIIEDKVDDVRRKHYTIWSKVPLSEIDDNPKIVKERVLEYHKTNDITNKLIIKKMPEEGTTIAKIKNYIHNYQKKFGIKFGLIVLDYLDCVESSKPVADTTQNEIAVIKGFMGLIDELNIPGWTAIQSAREGINLKWVEASQSGGSIKRIQKSHFFMSVGKDMDNKISQTANIQILKARLAQDGQRIEDCIYNNDTMEIRSTDDNWKRSIRKKKKSSEEELNKLHAAVSTMTGGETIADANFASNVDFDKENIDLLSNNQKDDITKKLAEMRSR